MSRPQDHVCQSEHVSRTGICEDFPCCGHLRGECGERAEFTSAYWVELAGSFDDPADYDAYCEVVDRQERGY